MYYLYHIPHPTDPTNIQLGYVGVTNDVKGRFDSHTKSIYKVGHGIRKYRLTFSCLVILQEFENFMDAYDKEKELRPVAQIGWNIAPGGIGGYRGPMTEETREKRRQSALGEKNGFFGKTHDKETRDHISNVLMNKSKEWRSENSSNAGKANLGKVRTDEARENYKTAASNRPVFTCEHCGKTGQYNSMIAYHGDKCKKRKHD